MKRVDKIFAQLSAQQNCMDSNSQEQLAESDNKTTYTTLTPVKEYDVFHGDPISGLPLQQIVSLETRLRSTTDCILSSESVQQNSILPNSDDQCFTIQGITNCSQTLHSPVPSNLQSTEYGLEMEDSDDSLKDRGYRPENDDGSSPTSEKSNDDEINAEPVVETGLKRTRWSTARPAFWIRNIEKKKRNQGQPYKSVTGKIQTPKIPRPVDCKNCRYKCTTNFSEDDRKVLCRTFWNLEYPRQKDFILMNVVSKEVKYRRPRKGEESKQRSNAKSYFFNKKDSKHQVCQSFFCKTLCISNIPIINAFQNESDSGEFSGAAADRRGRKAPANKTPEDVIMRVKEHIESCPSVESHYTRKSSRRLYLDPKLNIKKMYDLFMEECKEKQWPGVGLITYRRIFCSQYNLAFFKPKKDQCLTCNEYKQAMDKEKLELKDQEHLTRKEESMKEKMGSSPVDRSFWAHVPCGPY